MLRPGNLLRLQHALQRDLVLVERDAHDLEPLPVKLLIRSAHLRQFRHARPAPRRPEIHEHHLPAQLRQVHLRAVESLEFQLDRLALQLRHRLARGLLLLRHVGDRGVLVLRELGEQRLHSRGREFLGHPEAQFLQRGIVARVGKITPVRGEHLLPVVDLQLLVAHLLRREHEPLHARVGLHLRGRIRRREDRTEHRACGFFRSDRQAGLLAQGQVHGLQQQHLPAQRMLGEARAKIRREPVEARHLLFQNRGELPGRDDRGVLIVVVEKSVELRDDLRRCELA